jgi:hypothetical protein
MPILDRAVRPGSAPGRTRTPPYVRVSAYGGGLRHVLACPGQREYPSDLRVLLSLRGSYAVWVATSPLETESGRGRLCLFGGRERRLRGGNPRRERRGCHWIQRGRAAGRAPTTAAPYPVEAAVFTPSSARTLRRWRVRVRGCHARHSWRGAKWRLCSGRRGGFHWG